MLKHWNSKRKPLKLDLLLKKRKERENKKKKKRKKLVNLPRKWLLKLLPKKLERKLRKKD